MILEALAVAGLVTNIWGQLAGASAQDEAAQKNAELKRQQADELLARQTINEQIMRQKAGESAMRYGSAFAASGREGGGIGGILRIKREAEENISLSRREANYKANMLRLGADIDSELGSDLMTTGYLKATGTLLGGAGDFKKLYDQFGPIKETKGIN